MDQQERGDSDSHKGQTVSTSFQETCGNSTSLSIDKPEENNCIPELSLLQQPAETDDNESNYRKVGRQPSEPLLPEPLEQHRDHRNVSAHYFQNIAHVVCEFLKSYKYLVVAVFIVAVAICIPIYMATVYSYWCHTQTTKIIQMISPNESVTNQLNDANTKVETQKFLIEDLEQRLHEANEMNAALNVTNPSLLYCSDASLASPKIFQCNFSACAERRLEAQATSFNAVLTNTTWFPQECSDSDVMPEIPKCHTKYGNLRLLDIRPHPKCPGRLQFRCCCGGAEPKYEQEWERDCEALYKVCKKL